MTIDRKFKILAVNPFTNNHYTQDNSFLLCAKDKAVPAALRAYITECQRLMCEDGHIQSLQQMLERIQFFQAENGARKADTVGAELAHCINTKSFYSDRIQIRSQIDEPKLPVIKNIHTSHEGVHSFHGTIYAELEDDKDVLLSVCFTTRDIEDGASSADTNIAISIIRSGVNLSTSMLQALLASDLSEFNDSGVKAGFTAFNENLGEAKRVDLDEHNTSFLIMSE